MERDKQILLDRLISGETIGAASISHDLFWSLYREKLVQHVEVITKTVRRLHGKIDSTQDKAEYFIEITKKGEIELRKEKLRAVA